MKQVSLVSALSRLMAACLLLQLLISLKVWVPFHRSFPTVPLLEQWPVRWGAAMNYFFFFTMLGSCAVLLWKPFSRLAIGILLAGFMLEVLEDISRLQPWFFLFALSYSAWLVYDPVRAPGRILFALKLVLSSVYFWSGLQKVNVHFAVEMFPWLTEFTGQRAFVEAHHGVAYAVGGLEALAGMLLWLPSLKRTACIIIFGTHLFILLSLGPTGHNWNQVVWPWNLAFAGMVYLLFFRKTQESEKGTGRSIFYPALLCLFLFILPVLNFFGKWDHFLSGSYYSSVVSSGVITFAKEDAALLPASSKPFQFYSEKEQKGILLVDAWALDELKVPLYPEDRVHLAVSGKIRQLLRQTLLVQLRLFEKQRFDPNTAVLCFPH